MGKPKFGGVQGVAGAARRHRDALLGLLRTARDTLGPQHAARSCSGRSSAQILCASGLEDPPPPAGTGSPICLPRPGPP